jgi:hypothetical protein
MSQLTQVSETELCRLISNVYESLTIAGELYILDIKGTQQYALDAVQLYIFCEQYPLLADSLKEVQLYLMAAAQDDRDVYHSLKSRKRQLGL